MTPKNSLPDNVRILHKDFALRERTQKEFHSDDRLAEILFVEAEINFLPLPGSETADSIVHEVLHGIWKMMDIGLPDEEEHVVTVLSTGIVTVMRDNPTLFAALQRIVEEKQNRVLTRYPLSSIHNGAG